MAKKEKKPTDKLADRTALTKFLQGVFGDAQKKVLRRLWKRAQEINKLEPKYQKMSDKDLKAQTAIFKEKIEKYRKNTKNQLLKMLSFCILKSLNSRIVPGANVLAEKKDIVTSVVVALYEVDINVHSLGPTVLPDKGVEVLSLKLKFVETEHLA